MTSPTLLTAANSSKLRQKRGQTPFVGSRWHLAQIERSSSIFGQGTRGRAGPSPNCNYSGQSRMK
jgi:hypothetical protein